MTCTLALDIGGTKIAYALVPDARPLEVAAAGRLPTSGPGLSAAGQVSAALRAGRALAREHGLVIARVGMGAPGVIRSSEGVVSYNGETVADWVGTDLYARSAEILDVPCVAHNDVRVWAFGEHRLGAGRQLPDTARVLYVSLGTGVGGAIIDSGTLLPGPTGTAGEFAEIICADHTGWARRCEDVASGPGLSAAVNRAGGGSRELPEIIEALRAGTDPQAATVIRGNLLGFGRALGALASLLDLEAVVLGGGVAGIGAPVLEPVAAGIRENALAPNRGVRVTTTALGPAAAVLAAACFAREHTQSGSSARR